SRPSSPPRSPRYSTDRDGAWLIEMRAESRWRTDRGRFRLEAADGSRWRTATACLLSSCGPGLRFWVDEPTKRVVRRPVGDDRALAACSTSLVRKASAGSPAGRRGDHLPLPVRDRLARRAQRFRSLADGVEAPPGLGCGRDLG